MGACTSSDGSVACLIAVFALISVRDWGRIARLASSGPVCGALLQSTLDDMCLVEFTAFSAIVAATAALTAVCFGCCLHARYRGCGGIDLPSACMAANDLERLNSVHTLLRLSAPVDASDAVEFFERFALRCGGRFLQVLNTDAVWPKWEQSPVPFDAAQHVAVDDAVSDAYALQEAVCATLSEPMPRQRPPWRVVLYNNLPDSEGGPAVLLKMHHCMGDGVGLMRIVVQALMESHREVHADAQPTTGTGSRGAGSRRGGGRDRPSVFAMARRLPAAVFKILAMRPDRPSAVHRSDRIPPGSKRVAAWSSLDRAELGVDRLKKIAASLSCTINDLLVAAVCGGLRRYADEEGGQVAPATTLAVWFSLSPLSTVYKPITAESPARWGNGALGAVYLRGPLEERDSVERLDIVMKQTAALKASPEPWVAQSVMSLFGALPGVSGCACLAMRAEPSDVLADTGGTV